MAKTFATVTGHSLSRRVRAAVIGVAAAVGAVAIAVAVVDAPGGSASTLPRAAASQTPAQIATPSNPRTTDPSFFPPSNGPGQATITQTQAVNSAQAEAVSSTGNPLPSAEQAALPTFSRLMSYADAVKLTGDGADPRIDPSRQVWVVTVLGHHVVDTLPGSKTSSIVDRYTIVSDATTGFMILGAFGVASLTS